MYLKKIKTFISLVLLPLMVFCSNAFAIEDDEASAFAAFIKSVVNTTQGINSGVICVVGSDEISKLLVFQNPRTIDLGKAPDKFLSCKSIYFAKDRERIFRVDIDKYNKHKILTIAIFDGFTEGGGMLQIQVGRRNFELTLNSKLVRDLGIRLNSLATDLIIN